MIKSVTEIYSELKIVAEIDSEGVYRGIKNWDQLDVAIEKTVAICKRIVDEIEMPEKQRKAVWNMVMKQSGTRQAIERKITEPLQLLTSMTNSEFSKDETSEFESEVPYLGKALPAVEHYSISSFDPKSQRASVEWKSFLDEEKSIPLIEEALKKLAKDLDMKDKKMGSLVGFSIKSTGQFDMDLKTGWPYKVVTENVVGSDDSHSYRVITLTRK